MNSKYNLLFLSLQSNHSDIFQSIIRQLDPLLFSYTILDLTEHEKKLPLYEIITPARSRFVEETILRLKPDLIVVANDQGINAHFISIGKSKSIPSLAIQDGILSDSAIPQHFILFRLKSSIIWRLLSSLLNWKVVSLAMTILKLRPLVLAWGYGGANYYAVIGNASKDLLIARGVPENRIFTTGYPLLDKDTERNSESDSEVIPSPARKKIILFLDQPLHKDGILTREKEELLISSLVESIDFQKFSLVIKLHPRDSEIKYERMMARNEDISIVKDESNYNLAATSSLVITFSSSATIWAIRLGKPVIFFTPFHEPENPIANLGTRVTDISKLKEAIQLLANGNFMYDEQAIREILYEFDDKASERIANTICKILSENNEKRGSRETED